MILTKKENNILSMISHDLKSPLNGILGFSNLLKDELTKKNIDPKLTTMIDHISSAGDQMLQLVENILTFAKATAGKEILEIMPVDNLYKHFEETLKTFELEAKAKNISLTLKSESQLPTVKWDILRLRLHAFNNIISNALKFTPLNGYIRIDIKVLGDYIYILFQDNGPGISPDKLDSIFLPYEASSYSRTVGGNGLGLSNARHFIESHGGSIHADNVMNNDDEIAGARFIIEMPLDCS